MKKAIALFVCMGTLFCSYAQETPPENSNPLITKEDYLKKSKMQKTGAIVLLSVGGAITIAGLAVAYNDLSNDLDNLFTTNHTSNNNGTLSAVLTIIGVGSMLGSIGLFVSAHKYKRKALSLSFKNEMVPQLQRSMVFQQAVPSLSLKIKL